MKPFYNVTYTISHPSYKTKDIKKTFYNKKDFLYFYLFILKNRKLRGLVSDLKAFKNNIDITKKINVYLYSNRI